MLSDRDEPVYATGYWYVRLCLALGRKSAGLMSSPFRSLPPQRRARALAAVLELPPEIGLLSLRRLGPVIGELSGDHRPMNALSREALAAAVLLRATVLMARSNENHVLASGVAQEGLGIELVTVGA